MITGCGLTLVLGIIVYIVKHIDAGVPMTPRRRRVPRYEPPPPPRPLLASTLIRMPCTKCTGGVQALYRGEWGQIPDDHLMLQRTPDGDDVWRPPHANVRECPHCNGRNFFLVHQDNTDGNSA
jgi:hypothetical protein